MSSREVILQAVRQNKPAARPLPAPVHFTPPVGDPTDAFCQIVRAVGGHVIETPAAEVEDALRHCYPDASQIASSAPEYTRGTVDLTAVSDPHQLADLDLFVCEGALGVAENGAIWLPESRLGHRAAPFIAQHLAVILDRRHLVPDMHRAYEQLRADEDGYGVFIAGPSKTADIEQSLVIGAHGARSLTVLLLR
jgi:L-lactate dehydrogenase complex protein LldG